VERPPPVTMTASGSSAAMSFVARGSMHYALVMRFVSPWRGQGRTQRSALHRLSPAALSASVTRAKKKCRGTTVVIFAAPLLPTWTSAT
jgi:hypothetical protein